jgi:hypothetical protein
MLVLLRALYRNAALSATAWLMTIANSTGPTTSLAGFADPPDSVVTSLAGFAAPGSVVTSLAGFQVSITGRFWVSTEALNGGSCITGPGGNGGAGGVNAQLGPAPSGQNGTAAVTLLIH